MNHLPRPPREGIIRPSAAQSREGQNLAGISDPCAQATLPAAPSLPRPSPAAAAAIAPPRPPREGSGATPQLRMLTRRPVHSKGGLIVTGGRDGAKGPPSLTARPGRGMRRSLPLPPLRRRRSASPR